MKDTFREPITKYPSLRRLLSLPFSGQKSIRSDESFPDSPWRLTQNPWDDLGEANGKASDFTDFYSKSSGYIPEGKSSGVLGEYQPWVHSSAVSSIELEDLEIIMDASNYGYKVGYLKPQYDWGLYNGSRGSNPDNPNATGLYTYEGKELQGQWRTMRLEEVFYLLGLPPAKHSEKVYFSSDKGEIFDTDYFSPYISSSKFLDIILDYGGYSYRIDNVPIEVPFYTVNNAELENFALYYYDYTVNKWVPYDLIADVEVYTPDANEGGDAFITGGSNVRIVNPGAHHYDVLNSARYDSEGNPQYAVVTIIDKETMTTMEFIAILPDGWDDPCKNESSADGKIVKGRDVPHNTNVYTKERWKFFMEPSGAVLIESKYLFPRTFEGYGVIGRNKINWGGGVIMNNGKRLTYAFPNYFELSTSALQKVHLVRDAN